MEETFGKRIVRNRKRLGLTQDALAEKLGVTAQAVSKWENDQSCPDITTLPRLAEIFGITTDSLLGLEPPAKEAEVVENPGTGIHIDKNNNHWEFKWEGGRKGCLTLAVWIIAAALMLLAANYLNQPLSLWTALWTTGLTVFGLFHLFNRFSFHGLACTLAGGYYVLEELLPGIPILKKSYLLPVFLLILGLSLLGKAMKKQKSPSFCVTTNGKNKRLCSYQTDEEEFVCELAFGSHTQHVDLPRLSDGTAAVNFGELALDLRSCKTFSQNCTMDLECNFGSMNLLLPTSLRVIPESDAFAGNLRFSGQPDPDAQPIRLNCDISFGEIHVQYL